MLHFVPFISTQLTAPGEISYLESLWFLQGYVSGQNTSVSTSIKYLVDSCTLVSIRQFNRPKGKYKMESCDPAWKLNYRLTLLQRRSTRNATW